MYDACVQKRIEEEERKRRGAMLANSKNSPWILQKKLTGSGGEGGD